MLKRSLLILPALLITFTLNAQQVMVDKIVAVVGNSAIYYSDVVESANMLVNQRREMGYTSDRDPQNEALEQLMMQKLLYHQAQIDSVDVNTADIAITVEDYLQNMISEAGSIAALEEREHKAVFDIRETLRQYYEENMYAQAMQNDVTSKVTITPGEVERYYKTLPSDVFRSCPNSMSMRI